jgi:hypothetical protein
MSKETSARIAKIAGRVLEGGKYTDKEVRSMAASLVAQREIEQESIKAWAGIVNGYIAGVYLVKNDPSNFYELTVPVIISRHAKPRKGKKK